MSNSNATITLKARTDEFEARLKKAIGTFESLTLQGKNTTKAIDESMRQLTIASKGYVDKLEQSFNALQIKPDIALQKEKELLAANVRVIEGHYQKIAKDANRSTAEVTRAFKAMNDKIRQYNEQPLKSSFSTLGILPTSSIEAQRVNIKSAYEDIKRSQDGVIIKSNDVKRAQAAMNAELERLKRLSSGDPARNATKGINLLSLASTAAIVKIQLLYSLVNTTMSAIGSIPGLAMDAVESFEASSISGAAIITSMQKGVKDIGAAYKENKAYVEGTQRALIVMDGQTSASLKNLEDMNQQLRLHGVFIDANNEKQKQGLLSLANALSTLTLKDPNRDMQFAQEMNALLKGEDRTGNKLFKLLNSFDNGNLKESLKLWQDQSKEAKNLGLILEKFGPMLAGFEVAQEDINKLWATQKSVLVNIRDEILRDGFGPEFDRIIAKMQEVNEYGTANKDVIARMISGGFEDAHKILEFLKKYEDGLIAVTTALGIAKGAQILLNTAISKHPYVIAITALTAFAVHVYQKVADYKRSIQGAIDLTQTFVNSVRALKSVFAGEIDFKEYIGADSKELDRLLKERVGTGEINEQLDTLKAKLKDVNESWAFTDGSRKAKDANIANLKEEIKVIEDKRNALINVNATGEANTANQLLREKNKGGGVYAPPPPGNIDFGGTEDGDAAADKLLRAAERLNEKLAELQKSHNEIILSENANARKLELQKAENNYDERIISLSAYIKKKQDIEVAAIEEEIRTQQETVDAFQKVLDTGNFGYGGDKGAADKVEAQIKLNNAIKDLKNSEAELAVLRLKNRGELSKYYREEKDYVRNANIQYNEYAGNFVAAEKLRQESIAYTTELLRLQQAVVDKIPGSPEALASFKRQGEISFNKAQTAEEFNELDISNSKFGSDNEFDSITNKYIDMYKRIRDAEDEFGEGSKQANNLRWGSMVDMASDSMNVIIGLMMNGNKEMFVAGKALAISMAVINAAQSVTKALTLPYPMNFVVAGLVGAAAGVQVATIASQQYEGRALGGPVIAGQTYVVNENRRTEGPEYFTPGVSGVITPASKLRDASADDRESRITNVNQRIYVQGSVDNRTASQIARDTERKQRIAQVRFG